MRPFVINEQFPRGQKTTKLVLPYEKEIKQESLNLDIYKVKGRSITGVHTAKEICGERGNFVVVSLDPEDKNALTRKMKGFGPNTRTVVTGANISYKQKKSIRTVDDEQIKGSFLMEKVEAEISPVTDDFKLLKFVTEDGKELMYNLYIPKNVEKDEKLPLVLFMHDSSVCSDNPTAPLLQGMGAYIWATPSEQEKRRCYVLAPAYPHKTANDDFEVTWECEATVQLMEELCSTHAIDRNRIYGTGQSMGCMMLCELNVTHPELFAASYMVAGQWNPEKMATLHQKKLWILISEKDEKAFPIMSESVRLLEEKGAKIARGSLNAKSSVEEKQHFAEKVLSQNGNIQFTYYEGESNLPFGMKPFPGCYHLCTWLWSYDIEPIREWMFSQKK